MRVFYLFEYKYTTMYVPGAHGGQRRTSHLQAIELRMVVSYHMDAVSLRNRILSHLNITVTVFLHLAVKHSCALATDSVELQPFYFVTVQSDVHLVKFYIYLFLYLFGMIIDLYNIV